MNTNAITQNIHLTYQPLIDWFISLFTLQVNWAESQKGWKFDSSQDGSLRCWLILMLKIKTFSIVLTEDWKVCKENVKFAVILRDDIKYISLYILFILLKFVWQFWSASIPLWNLIKKMTKIMSISLSVVRLCVKILLDGFRLNFFVL